LLTEKSGILNWLIERALRWRREGLNVPADITDATDEYQGEMDVIGNFLKERCVQKPGAAIRARELFQVYQDWCDVKTKSWAGKVRPAVVVWRRGRQDAARQGKKRKLGRLRYFLLLGP
jgi:phage/plasmid-associated DNA primase